MLLVLVPFAVSALFRDHWKTMCKVFGIMLIGVQGVALLSLTLTTKIPDYSENKITEAGLLEVSGGDNVIIFCLDRFDQTYAVQMLEEYPDSMDDLKGFIYYPNATGSYSYTHIAVPYLLTGEKIPEYNPTNEQFCEQMEKSGYFNSLIQNVGNVGIYTNEFCLRSTEAREKIDNCAPLQYRLYRIHVSKACIRASLYRILPFVFKNQFVYTSWDFNSAICTKVKVYNADTSDTEARMLENLQNEGLVINDGYGDSAFRFIHVHAMHPTLSLDENCNYIWWEETDVAQCAAGEMKMIGKYCERLDELGLFEDATIIITADHGATRVLEDGDQGDVNVNPVFIYKPKGVSRKAAVKTSLAPVAHEDIFATVLDAFGLETLQYQNTIDSIDESKDRIRYYYWPYQDPEVDYESCFHIEYAVYGDSRDPDSWERTGNVVYPNK